MHDALRNISVNVNQRAGGTPATTDRKDKGREHDFRSEEFVEETDGGAGRTLSAETVNWLAMLKISWRSNCR